MAGPVLLAFIAIILLLALIYLAILRPRSHRRGATQAELAQAMPGDDLVPESRVGYTQAITINAPPSEVWPWLVQIGYKRAGWYTYDWVYKLMGADDFFGGNRSANRIIPELQEVQVGDQIKIFEQAPFTVMAAEPDRALVLLARVDLDTNKYFELDQRPDKFLNNSWSYLLQAQEGNKTRLIVRWRGDYSSGLGNALGLGIPTEAGALIMQPKMLKGIKSRAESTGTGG